jgi:hypothetical protein
MRIKRAMMGCLLAALGAMPIMLNGTPALAREIMTWNLQGATFTDSNNNQSGVWPLVLDKMADFDKEFAAIQEAGSSARIRQQLAGVSDGPVTRTLVDRALVIGLPDNFNVFAISGRFAADGSSYNIYVLEDIQPNQRSLALVLRNVTGRSLRVIPSTTGGCDRPAFGISVGNGPIYFSIHAPASCRAFSFGPNILALIDEALPNIRWVALGDWNINIGNESNRLGPRGNNLNTPFGADIANPDLVNAQVYRSDSNTQDAREPDGLPRSALDYAFANYAFASPVGTVIGQPDLLSPSDHLPVNYNDAPTDPGQPSPPSPPAPPNANLDGARARITLPATGQEITYSSEGFGLALTDPDIATSSSFTDQTCLAQYTLSSIAASYVLSPCLTDAPNWSNGFSRFLLSGDGSVIDESDAWIFQPDGQGNVFIVSLADNRRLVVAADGSLQIGSVDSGTAFRVEVVPQ